MDDKERTNELNRIALKFSEFYKGKVGIMPRVPITSLKDFSYWYTPGVAAVSLAVNHNVEDVFNLTGKWS